MNIVICTSTSNVMLNITNYKPVADEIKEIDAQRQKDIFKKWEDIYCTI